MFDELLETVLRLKDIVLTVGSPESVAELFIKEPDIKFAEGWLTCECRDWHVHMRCSDLSEIRFVEAPSHGSEQLSYSIRFMDKEGKERLTAYFLDLYDESGALREEKLEPYRRLKAEYGKGE
jgi:putative heme iron utilization protein